MMKTLEDKYSAALDEESAAYDEANDAMLAALKARANVAVARVKDAEIRISAAAAADDFNFAAVKEAVDKTDIKKLSFLAALEVETTSISDKALAKVDAAEAKVAKLKAELAKVA